MPQFAFVNGGSTPLQVVGTSGTPEGALYAQVKLADGRYLWVKPGDWQECYYSQDMESWQVVPTADEFAAAQAYAAQMRAAADAFKAEFMGGAK